MKTLAEIYPLTRHFQRSRRVDADLGADGLNGYVLNASAWRVLQTLAEDIQLSRQRAFTWTGPYGSGKSSLALLLAGLLSPDVRLQAEAVNCLGRDKAAEFYGKIGRGDGWLVVRAVGRRADPLQALWDDVNAALEAEYGPEHDLVRQASDLEPSVFALADLCLDAASLAASRGGGLLFIVDEMGKFLEYAALEGGDVFIFQELAERFGRSKADAVLLGILHQSIQDYGRRAASAVQSEWTKVQGRFVDVPFSIGLDEVVALIGQALGGRKPSPAHVAMAEAASMAVENSRFRPGPGFTSALAQCAPLNPITALLLGPISRRRFGQNERSVFSFLASREVCGFGAFLELQPAASEALYGPADLWDFLQLNLEPTILASPDGAKWAVAAEAVARAAQHAHTSDVHVRLAKAIAIIELFGQAHGVAPSDDVLSVGEPGLPAASQAAALDDLRAWSVAVYRRYRNGWGVFAGSDVDLEAELAKVSAKLAGDASAFARVLPSVPPVVAKRHYYETGNLWIFDCRVTHRAALPRLLSDLDRVSGSVGHFILITDAERGVQPTDLIVDPAPVNFPYFIGVLPNAQVLEATAVEVAALEQVSATLPALAGDAAARRELHGRQSAASAALASELKRAFESAIWATPKGQLREGGASQLASDLCDELYGNAPKIRNELINRDAPSSAAKAARRRLMHLMVTSPQLSRLGIEGEPAELGLYLSLLRVPGLHVAGENGWTFAEPKKNTASRIGPVFAQFSSLLSEAADADRSVSFAQLYEIWRAPPFGVRDGVAPVLALAAALAGSDTIALYVDGNFTPEWDAIVVDRLLQDPKGVALRQISLGSLQSTTLVEIAAFVDGQFGACGGRSALEVTRPLVQLALRLPPWARRTRTLSDTATRLRDALLAARDPYLLLQAIPAALGVSEDDDDPRRPEALRLGLKTAAAELVDAQGRLVAGLQAELLPALDERVDDPDWRTSLVRRANIVILSTVEPRLKHFAQKLVEAGVEGSDWVQQLSGFVVGKPMRDWLDADIDRARSEMLLLAEHFLDVEACAKLREGDALRYSVLLQDGANERRIVRAVSVNQKARAKVEQAVAEVLVVLERAGLGAELEPAALALAMQRLTGLAENAEQAA